MTVFRIKKILREIPETVTVLAAAKGRRAAEIDEAVRAGVRVVGENYLQEAEQVRAEMNSSPAWHMIGHLQTNKVKKAVEMFDMIQTLDSLKLAEKIDKECAAIDKVMPVLVEVNCAREKQKSGIIPEKVIAFIAESAAFPRLSLQGIMTMGPLSEKEESIRPYFREMKKLFDAVKEEYRDRLSQWQYLSMGMSSSYRTAIDEGATMVRLGTVLFGPRG